VVYMISILGKTFEVNISDLDRTEMPIHTKEVEGTIRDVMDNGTSQELLLVLKYLAKTNPYVRAV